MKLATPISHLIKDEKLAGPILNNTDCFEVRDHTMNSNLPNQYLYHCDLQPIHEWPEEEFLHLEKVKVLKPELKLITFHCASCCDKPVLQGKVWVLGGRTYSRQEMIETSKKNFKRIREIFGPDVQLAVENNNYYKTAAYDIVCDPDFISEVVEENNLRLLCDLAHAQISAHNKGMKFEDYLYSNTNLSAKAKGDLVYNSQLFSSI